MWNREQVLHGVGVVAAGGAGVRRSLSRWACAAEFVRRRLRCRTALFRMCFPAPTNVARNSPATDSNLEL